MTGVDLCTGKTDEPCGREHARYADCVIRRELIHEQKALRGLMRAHDDDRRSKRHERVEDHERGVVHVAPVGRGVGEHATPDR